MKGKKGYLKRMKPAFENFQKRQRQQQKKSSYQSEIFGIKPDTFKKEKSKYRQKRDLFILKLSRIHKTIQKISDALWGEGYHPFFTNSARDKYISKSIKAVI